MGKGCLASFFSGMLSGIMRDTDLFQLALGLSSPWEVESSRFAPDKKRLDIILCFARGSTFTCPDCGQMSLKAHDTIEKTWRHLRESNGQA